MSVLDPSSSTPQIKRNRAYYLDTLTFKVEDEVFKVPRHHFQQNSEIFGDAFTLPGKEDGSAAEEQSDENPIVLEGISKVDFERFLSVLYPLNTPPTFNHFSKDEWISVLKLSTLWNFVSLRTLTIRELSPLLLPLPPTERIFLAHQYNVSPWLRSGYTELARRPGTLSMEEAARIGWETAFKITRAREETVKHHVNGGTYAKVDVEQLFGDEMKRADETFGVIETLEYSNLFPAVPQDSGKKKKKGKRAEQSEDW